MSYDSHKYDKGNLYASIVKKMFKLATIYGPICGYCNGCQKNQLQNLYSGIAMDVKKKQLFTKTYMRILEWM